MAKNTNDDNSLRVERHMINQNHELYKILDEQCFNSKNLYNYANYHIRQVFILTSKLNENENLSTEQQEYLNFINSKVDDFNALKVINYEKAKTKALQNNKEFEKKLKQVKYFSKDNKYLGYDFLEFLVKEGNDYKSLIAPTSQQILKLLDKNWKSFFESIKDWSKNKDKYTGRPKLPKYLNKHGRNIIIYTNQNAVKKDNYIQLPKCLNQFELNTNIKESIQQVRVLPRNNYFILEVVYKINPIELKQDNQKYVSIDIGLDNLATMVNNTDALPIILNGRTLKSINKYYNKQMSHYREIAKRMNNLDYTKRMNKLTIKRNNMITDYIHKASRRVIEYALSCEANTIIIGNNKDWKRESKLSKNVNQSFVGIPHQEFINKIIYKANDLGINVIVTEESYTSGTSFLDNELPIKENYNKSRRIKRGLFKSNNGKLINADVNGAFQIMKKVIPNIFANVNIDGIKVVGLQPIRVNI